MAEGTSMLPVSVGIDDLMRMQRRVAGLYKQQRKAKEDKQQMAPPP
jgi:hypothetical protein